MINNKNNKNDGQFHDRTWVELDQSRRSKDGIFKLQTRSRHNKIGTDGKQNGSTIYAQASIADEYSEWLTVYPDSRGMPHRDINDYFDETSYSYVTTDPLSYFIDNSRGSNYLTAELYDNHPRAPLNTADSVTDNRNDQMLEHTIAYDIKEEFSKKKGDHMVATIIRPITIKARDSKIENTASLEGKIGNILSKLLLDRRCEGVGINSENTERDDSMDKGYYVQLIEIIGKKPRQQSPDNPVIEEGTNWSGDKHDFDVETTPLNKSLKKLRRAQTDIRSSRIRWAIPYVDYKKRAFAVSQSDLKLFTMHEIDDNGHR